MANLMDLELLQRLLGESAVPPVQLCRGVVAGAAGRLGREADKLEHSALQQDLRTARLLLISRGGSGEEGGGYGEVALELLQRVCLPYLDVLFQDCAAHIDAVQAVAETVAAVLLDPCLPAEVVVWTLRDGVSPLVVREMGGGEGGGGGEPDTAERLSCLTEFLCGLFSQADIEHLQQVPGCAEQLSALFPLLLSLLDLSPAGTCQRLLSSLLPPFITASHPHRLSAVWAVLREVWSGRRLVELHPLAFSLALLCCFSDVLIARDHTSPFVGEFPPGVADLCPLLDVRAEGVLWEVLGAGLRSSDPLDRKRAKYLLHRVLCSVRGGRGEVVSDGGVFWWRGECEGVLSAVWDDLVLLLHTLEEKQVHIVKPVKSRMRNIVQATSTYIDGRSVLHMAWLELALERVFMHTEAKSIVRWGVSEALSLDLPPSPLLLPQHWQFVFGPLLQVLSETMLYSREQSATPTDLCPPIASRLTSFLQSFVSSLPPTLRGEFLQGLLAAIEVANLAEIPLLHLTHSLSLLPPAPLLGPAHLATLRSVLVSCLRTHKHLLRGAVQSFLLATAANLADLSVVGYWEVAMVLGSVRDSLLFSSPSWVQAREWLAAACAASDVPLSSFLSSSLTSFLDQEDSGQGARLGHAPLAMLILLTVDAQLSGLHCLPASCSLEQLLTSLLHPLTSDLSSAPSRPYLPQHSLTLSLNTLTSLITTFLSGHTLTPTYRKGTQSETGKMLYKCLLPWLPGVVQSLQELLLKGSKDGTRISLPYLHLLTSSLSALHNFSTLYNFPWFTYSDASPAHLASRAAQTLHSALHAGDTVLTPAVLGAVTALGWVCGEDTPLPAPCFSLLRSLPLSLSLTRPSVEDAKGVFERVEWGPVMAHCSAAHWTTLQYCLRHQYSGERGGAHSSLGSEPLREGRTDISAMWATCSDSVDTVAASQLPHVVDCISLLLPQVGLGEVAATMENCWRAVSESPAALPSFLGLLLHPHLLVHSDTTAEQPVHSDTTAEQPVHSDTTVEQPVHSDTTAEQPVDSDTTAEQPVHSDTTAEQLVDSDTTAEQPVDSDTTAEQLVDRYCEEVLALGERRSGVVNAMATAICARWREEWEVGRGEKVVVESLQRHKALILQLCCFGSIHRKNIRSMMECEQFVRSLGDQVPVNCSPSSSEVEGDSGVRVTVLSFLVGVASSVDHTHSLHTHFLPQFITAILQQLSELSATKPRYFINSLTHRLKQRLLQTLLLLLPHLPPTEEGGVAQGVLQGVLQALQADNQTSVRHLLEWAVVMLVARQPSLVSTLLLPALQPDSEFRLSRLPSLCTVAMHLSGAGSLEQRATYGQAVLPTLFQWTTCHHFVVRLYAQRAVEVVWGVCGEEDALIGSCIPFLKKHSDAAKFNYKLTRNVFFSLVRPLSDLSVEVVFDWLPRLCGMAEEECVSAGDFREAWERWGGGRGEGGTRIPLYCDSSVLREAVKMGRVEGGKGDDSRSVAHQLGDVQGGAGEQVREDGDVQKKITRWASKAAVLGELFPGLAVSQRAESGAGSGGLVLVASLLTKTPNLGGLCRTCEIFGVQELVLPSLSVLEDPQFTALSVTAHHWLKISEVRLPQLSSYLLAKREEGYRLVGAEQTAHSKSLTSYPFQPRTVLLLGNEREGIPVQLIHLMQECVQIPQLGLVRSLNVHVSGALLVWEYCKQHLLGGAEHR